MYGQNDSVPTLLKKFNPQNYKLQWEEGFVVVAFQSALLTGVSADFIGIQYKEMMHVSIGMDEAANNIFLNPGYTDPKTYTAPNAHFAYYLNVEPLFFSKHLFTLSIPVKISYTANVAGHQSTYNDNFNIAPGIDVSVHMLQNLSLGAGACYRFDASNLFTGTSTPDVSNDTYNLWLFLRIGLK